MYQEETLKYKTGDSLINSLIHVLEHPHNTQSSSFCNHGNHDLIINYSFFVISTHPKSYGYEIQNFIHTNTNSNHASNRFKKKKNLHIVLMASFMNFV